MRVLPSFLKLLEECLHQGNPEEQRLLPKQRLPSIHWCSADFRAVGTQSITTPEGARKQSALVHLRDRESITEQAASWGLTRGRVSGR